MRSRPRSASTAWTVRFWVVCRTAPMRPAIRTPLKTRLGVAQAPIEPGERCLRCVPCAAPRPLKPCRFMTPAVPLPLVRPTTSTFCPASKTSAVTSWPGVYSPASDVRISATKRRGVTPAFAKWPASGLFTLRGAIAPNAMCTRSYPPSPPSRTCVTTHGPAWTTVTGTSRPAESQTWVMPSFSPSTPFTCRWIVMTRRSSELDLDVDTRRQVETHQRVDGLRRGVQDVDQPLVRAHLEGLAAVLVLVRRTDHAVHVLLCGQRHRTGHRRRGADHRVDDLARRAVDDLVVVGLQPDADLLSRHGSLSSLPCRPVAAGCRTLQCCGAGPFGPRGRACRAFRRSASRVTIRRPGRTAAGTCWCPLGMDVGPAFAGSRRTRLPWRDPWSRHKAHHPPSNLNSL